MNATSYPRRATRAHLHVLPPGAGDRGAGRADAAHARRPDHRRDRSGVPRSRADDGATAGAGQAQDQGRRHPVPGPAARPARPSGSAAVLAVIYLIFNEGYSGRGELTGEALWLGQLARRAAARPTRGARPPRDDAAARRPPRQRGSATASSCCSPTRTGAVGRRADRAGRAVLDRAFELGGDGPYVVQAAIASLPRRGPTDWARIARCTASCRQRHRVTDRRAEPRHRRRRGRTGPKPRGGSSIELALDDYRYFHATRGELLRRVCSARRCHAAAYDRALDLTTDQAERRSSNAASWSWPSVGSAAGGRGRARTDGESPDARVSGRGTWSTSASSTCRRTAFEV